jgi:hypothetical protein
MFELANDNVIGHYYKGLDSISRSGLDCEPLTRHAGVGPKIAAWLVERGLIETGESPRYPYAGRCYRVTELGREVFNRGPRARRAGTEI